MSDRKDRKPAATSRPDGGRLSSEQIREIRNELVFGNRPQFADPTRVEVPAKPVGYKSPPINTRFQTGQSGNPNGRPRKKQAVEPSTALSLFHELFLRQVRRPISVREGGVVTDMDGIEAVIRAQLASALKGNARAQSDILQAIKAAMEQERLCLEAEHEIWRNIRDSNRSEYESAAAKGEPEPERFPHHEDIVIEPGERVRIIGPRDREEAKRFQHLCQLRDQLLLQSELDRRHYCRQHHRQYHRPYGASETNGLEAPRPHDPNHDLDRDRDRDRDHTAASGKASVFGDDGLLDIARFRSIPEDQTALMMALLINGDLPKRMQLTDGHIAVRTMRNEGLNKRALLKAVYQGWRTLGLRRWQRGKPFPRWSEMYQALGCLLDWVILIRRGSNTNPSPAETHDDMEDHMRMLTRKWSNGPAR